METCLIAACPNKFAELDEIDTSGGAASREEIYWNWAMDTGAEAQMASWLLFVQYFQRVEGIQTNLSEFVKLCCLCATNLTSFCTSSSETGKLKILRCAELAFDRSFEGVPLNAFNCVINFG